MDVMCAQVGMSREAPAMYKYKGHTSSGHRIIVIKVMICPRHIYAGI